MLCSPTAVLIGVLIEQNRQWDLGSHWPAGPEIGFRAFSLQFLHSVVLNVIVAKFFSGKTKHLAHLCSYKQDLVVCFYFDRVLKFFLPGTQSEVHNDTFQSGFRHTVVNPEYFFSFLKFFSREPNLRYTTILFREMKLGNGDPSTRQKRAFCLMS